MLSIGCRNIEVWLPVAFLFGRSSLISTVRVNVVSGLLVGSGVYIQLCVTQHTPVLPETSTNVHTREYPAIFITYSLICTLYYHVGKWSLSDSCGLACSLTVLIFLASSTVKTWPDWRGGGEEPIIVVYITGVLIMLGVKGYELSHLVQR